MSFLFGIIQSIIASIILKLYESNESLEKDSFKKKSIEFHKSISPYLIEKILKEQSLQVYRKLEKITIDDETIRLPYISLITNAKLSINPKLQKGRRRSIYNKKLIDWMINDLGKKVYNGSTFTLMSISSDNKLSIGVSDYESTISTSDIHYYNLIRNYPNTRKRIRFFSYEKSRIIKEWISNLESIVLRYNFSGYHASIGCSVLTVLKAPDGSYKYLVKKNSTAKNSAHEKHVIPSFMYQPSSSIFDDQERELGLKASVIREYGEELLGIKEMEEPEGYDSLKADILNPNIEKTHLLRKLINGLNRKDYILETTGLVIDLYRLRPEITFLLIINDPDFYKNIKTNWETKKGSLEKVLLTSDADFQELLFDQESPFCAPGLAAILNGRQRAIEILSSKNEI